MSRSAEPKSYQEILDRGYVRGRDFSVRTGNLENIGRCLLVAPHGGGIEPGTTEIMHAVADLGGWAYYHFDGRLHRGNGGLHITSTRFDEPDFVALFPQTPFILSFHGASGGKRHRIFVGGRHDEGRRVLLEALNADLAALDILSIDATQAKHAEEIKGTSPQNITNQGRLRMGVQLEFSGGARLACFGSLNRAGRRRPTPTLEAVTRSIDRALAVLTQLAPRLKR